MGLFGNKRKIPDGARVVFYEGDLDGFQFDYPCQILLMEDVLRITKIDPYVEVKLDRGRITSVDIMAEIEYMKKYKGVSVANANKIPKEFYVINYINKNGESAHLDFWGASMVTLKILKIKDTIAKSQATRSYDI